MYNMQAVIRKSINNTTVQFERLGHLANTLANYKITSLFSMFNVYYGTSIDLSGFSIAKSTNNNNFITIANSLVNLKAPSNINKSINITADNLSVES